jgi:hypothetical protein
MREVVAAGGLLPETGERAPHAATAISNVAVGTVAQVPVHWDIADGLKRER